MKSHNDFLLGAATAAHQVEGNNIHSDSWAMEQMKHSLYSEPSLDAVDHYHRYKEDIELMQRSGLNAYRFSIEWARIEPVQGEFDEREIAHYRDVLQSCHNNGIIPMVTMHHFSSPKWMVTEGGWEAESTIGYFKRYCEYIAQKLGDAMLYVCTINEANMGLQLADIMKRHRMKTENMQVGINAGIVDKMADMMRETAEVFGVADPRKVYPFLSQRTVEGDVIIAKAHEAARDAMKAVCPHLLVGLSLSLHDIQWVDGGKENAQKAWEEEFSHYLPYIKQDDFLGVQNYTRKVYGQDGLFDLPDDTEKTQMSYEFYPQALEAVIRKVSKEFRGDIIVTENGVATDDDSQRVAFIQTAVQGVRNCINEGIPVKGYFYWSLLDNFEWHKGYSMQFGLIAVDRITQIRYPKNSLLFLGECKKLFVCKI